MSGKSNHIINTCRTVLNWRNKLNESIDKVKMPVGPEREEDATIYSIAVFVTMLFFAAVVLSSLLLLNK